MTLNPYAAAVRALNALLSRESWARERLRPHAGKRARLIAGPADVVLGITAAGLVEWHPAPRAEPLPDEALPEPAPDVTLTVAGDKLASLFSADTAQRMGAVRIEGDAALAQIIGDLARDLRWDVEDDLARVVGDIPAARLNTTARRVAQGVREGAWRFAGNVAEYLTEESGAVASRYKLEQWSAEVRRLRDDAERSAKRLQLLNARVAGLAGRAKE